MGGVAQALLQDAKVLVLNVGRSVVVSWLIGSLDWLNLLAAFLAGRLVGLVGWLVG